MNEADFERLKREYLNQADTFIQYTNKTAIC